MLEVTSWHDWVFPAAKPVTDLETRVLAAGLSSHWDLPPQLQHPKEIRKGHLREQAVPKQMAEDSSEWRWEQGRKGRRWWGFGHCGNGHTGLQDPGVGSGALSVVSRACCWNHYLETTCSATVPPLHQALRTSLGWQTISTLKRKIIKVWLKMLFLEKL